jgi:hypothetical protein
MLFDIVTFTTLHCMQSLVISNLIICLTLQLKDLQRQLDVKESQEKNFEVAKSTKKFCKEVRKGQIEKANMDTFKDLAEAEEELERVKIEFEKEIENMKFEKMRLQEELRSLKSVNMENSSAKKDSVSSGILTVSRSPSLSTQVDIATKSPQTINENEEFEESPQPKNKNENDSERFEDSPQHEDENENDDNEQDENEDGYDNNENGDEDEDENEVFEESPKPAYEKESKEESPVFEVEDFRAKFESQTVENSPVAGNSQKSPVKSFRKKLEAAAYHDSAPVTTKAVSRSCISLLASKYRDENDPKASLSASSTRSSAADEFSQRMQRDQRFKKIREMCSETVAKLQDIPLNDVIVRHGTVRSPLSPLREDKNSPIKNREIMNENLKNGFPKKNYSSNDKENSPKQEIRKAEKGNENSPKKEFWEKSSSQRKDFWEKEKEKVVAKVVANDVMIQKESWENNNTQRKEFWEKQKQTTVTKDVFQDKDLSWEESLRGKTDRSRTALNTSAVRDRIVYWEKEKSSIKEPDPCEKDVCWEKSLRCTESAKKRAILSAHRFDTSPQRAMSPLTRLGKLIDIPVSQLAKQEEMPVPLSQSKPLLPARLPVHSTNPLPVPTPLPQPSRAIQAKVHIPTVYTQSVFVPTPAPRVQGMGATASVLPTKAPAPSRCAPTRTIANIPVQPTVKETVPKVTVAAIARSATLRSAASSHHAPVERAPSPPSRSAVASVRSAAPSYPAPIERAPSPPSRSAVASVRSPPPSYPAPIERAPSPPSRSAVASVRSAAPSYPAPIERAPSPPSRSAVASVRSAPPSYPAPIERAPSPPSRSAVASVRSAAPSYPAPVERALSPPNWSGVASLGSPPHSHYASDERALSPPNWSGVASLGSPPHSHYASDERALSPPNWSGVASLGSPPHSRHASVERALPPSRPTSACILAIETSSAAMPLPLRAPSARIASTRSLCPLHPISIDTLCPRVPSVRVDMHEAPVVPIFSMASVQHNDPAPPAHAPPKTEEGEGCITPRTRAKCVSARNVISARIDHKVLVPQVLHFYILPCSADSLCCDS